METKTPVVIFDLDGTLALIEHRRHFVTDGNKDWDSFFAACVDDLPNIPVIETCRALHDQHYIINIFSGRSDAVKEETKSWLKLHGIPHATLVMRREGDFTSDVELKRSWIDSELREKTLMVFDDRDSVVKMWREEGFVCAQVAAGDF